MSQKITEAVQNKYGAVAKSDLSSNHSGVAAVAKAFGYSEGELASIPAEANMGLSCGNPIAHASLREGEVVVDLGCGGGLDVFLAAQKVGPAGKAIGIDMTPAMIERAKKNAAAAGVGNVEFHLARIEQLPLADGSVDCVISNCVINLAPEKKAVFREIARVLRPGGRVAVSDIALRKALPTELAGDLMAYVGCIAGAIFIDEYREGLIEAGFAQVEIVDSGSDLNAYSKVENQSGCCSPVMEETPAASACSAPSSSKTRSLAIAQTGCCSGDTVHGRLGELLKKYNVNDYAASVKVLAVKG